MINEPPRSGRNRPKTFGQSGKDAPVPLFGPKALRPARTSAHVPTSVEHVLFKKGESRPAPVEEDTFEEALLKPLPLPSNTNALRDMARPAAHNPRMDNLAKK